MSLKISSRKWQLTDVEAIIFDKDGTLIDVHPYWAEVIKRRAKVFVSHFKLPYEEEKIIADMLGLRLDGLGLKPEGPIARVTIEDIIHIFEIYLREKGIQSSKEEIISLIENTHRGFVADAKEFIFPLNGALDIVKKAKALKLPLALVTADTEGGAKSSLELIGLLSYFDIVIGRDSVEGSKKTGKPALKACEALGVRPKDTIAIGDTETDMAMANAAKLKAAIGVASGQVGRDELEVYTSYICEGLDEIELSS